MKPRGRAILRSEYLRLTLRQMPLRGYSHAGRWPMLGGIMLGEKMRGEARRLRERASRGCL